MDQEEPNIEEINQESTKNAPEIETAPESDNKTQQTKDKNAPAGAQNAPEEEGGPQARLYQQWWGAGGENSSSGCTVPPAFYKLVKLAGSSLAILFIISLFIMLPYVKVGSNYLLINRIPNLKQ